MPTTRTDNRDMSRRAGPRWPSNKTEVVMLVKELIAELQKQNPEAEVFRYDDQHDGVVQTYAVTSDDLKLLVLTKKGEPAAVVIY